MKLLTAFTLSHCLFPKEFHGLREAEHSQRTRYSRLPTPFPWKEAAAEILNDEVLDGVTAEFLIKELGRAGGYKHGHTQRSGMGSALALEADCVCQTERVGGQGTTNLKLSFTE